MSIGTLCDHGCEATFNDNYVLILNKWSVKVIMKGTRDPRKNLYMLNLTQQNKLKMESTTSDEYFAGSSYECKSKKTLVDYHHASCWSPTQSELGKAITKNFFNSWPGLSFDLVHKYLSKKINHTWAPSATSKMPQINTGKGNPIQYRSRTRPISTIHAVRRHQSCLPQESGSNSKIVHGPNRKVPSYIQQGQQLYPDSLPL